MPRIFIRAAIAVVLTLLASSAGAYAQDSATRDAEWRAYKLPPSDFVRFVHPSKTIMLRVPTGWKQQGAEAKFDGPEQASVQLFIEKIPDGLPLQAVVTGALKSLRNLPGGSDSLTVRRTQLSGGEAREILFELPDAKGNLSRTILLCAVDGPNAITLFFSVPLTRAAELEPYFKAIVQSAVIFRNQETNDFLYEEFESLRKAAIKESLPARIDEVQSLVSELDGGDSTLRAKAVLRLASIFAASPDSAIDLVLEQRPVVRAGAVDAIAASGNTALDPFLFNALSDRDSYVAARSAAAVAARPDAVGMIRKEIGSHDYTMLLRAAAFLDEKARIQIATELFNGTFKASSPDLRPPAIKDTPRQPAPPSPPAEAPPGGQPASGQKKPATGPRGPKEAMEVPGGVPGGIPNGKIGFVTLKNLPVLNEDFLALNLVREMPVSTFKVPLTRIIARKIDSVTASMLQIAFERREKLPLDELIKLLSSSNPTVAHLAALNIPRAAGKSDISRIESLAEKFSRQSRSPAHDAGKQGAEPALAADLRASIARIRTMEQVESADQQSRSLAIQKALDDPQLADWVWTEYAREALEGSVAGTRASPTTSPASPVQVSPLGENMLPRDVSLYVALPSPAAALGKLNNGLANLQTESARSQATLLLMMSAIKAQIAKFFGAQSNEAVIEHLGIKPDQPIAFAKWTAEGAPRGLRAAERKAVLVHVSDRDRFEHFLAHYQGTSGNFARLPELVSAITRFLGFAPAILPMGALTVLKEDTGPAAPKPIESVKYHLIGRDECLGHAIKVFERREATVDVPIKSTSVYLAYFGDAAVLAPDWFSLRDALSRLDNNRGGLAANPEFKRAVATGGDAIYLSSLSSLVKLDRKKSGDEVTESGSLKMSNAAWENSYQLSFPKAGWESLFSRFDAKSLASPRELLPRSTLGYIFARPDMQTLWSKWGNEFFGPVTSKNLASIWAMDFDKEVVPEFANEFGAAVLSLPKLDTGKFDAPWVVFLKLKTDKLSRAFSEGKLFKESAAGGRPVKLKIGSSNLVAAIKNGYLVFGPNEAAIGQLDQKEKLYTARDFSRAAERAPPTVVAFGGYSLEAAVAELGTNADPMKAFIINAATSMARAFHSQNFYATETPGGLEARLSVSLDREGRYSVAELQSLSKGFGLTFAVIEARGVPIADQARVETLKVRIRSKAPGVVDRIREDIASPHQTSEKRSENEIVLAVKPRHATPARKVPISEIGSGFEPFLKSTSELRSDDPTVIKQALEIVGADREAWSVARKLSDWTYKNLKWKSVDKADAAQTLATREADCLEFSQLFVAMARSLHLPARIVSGLAYSGGSFGGHAWVEVWAGEWVELDPTWGTDFVDATHIRTAADELIGYAALNLIEVEVLEAPRAVPDFQRSARSFAEKLRDDLSAGTRLSFTLDAVALTDEHMGAGAWSAMTDRDREQISAAYLSLAAGLPARFKTEGQTNSQGRLINVTQNGDRADALLSFNYLTTRFKLGRKGDAWTLLEIVYSASDYHVMHESLQPVIQAIRGRRSGKQPAYASQSAQTQLLVALQNGDSLGKRIPELLHIADEALKEDPKNQTLRHLKALCLSNVENDAKNAEEAVAIWKQLSEEEPPFGPALITLAAHYQIEESKDLKRAIELLQRYAALVPDDPEPHSSLADLYEGEGDLVRAEAARRAEIDRDPLYPDHYTALAELLAVQKRYEEACSAIDEGAKHGQTADVLFADLFQNLYDNDRETVVEGLAAAKPERLNRNVDALITLAEIRVDGGKAGDALPLLKRAVQLAPRHGGAHDAMALAYRTLANWQAALVEADAAIKINAEDGTAHFHRACALAQLGRKTQAIAALKRAIEIDSEVADLLEDTDDLKPLAQMPEFKKLIAPKPEK